MTVLEKLSGRLGKHMAFVVLFVAALALFFPATCLWIDTSWVNYLLMVIMFGMGLTLKLDDFKVVFTRPRDVLAGCVAQFTIMPLLAFVLGKSFGLDQEILAGVILVGACPGGTASNVITYLGKGDVALSVGMTSVNTLLSPALTPAIVYFLLRTTVDVDVLNMFLAILQVVVVPIGLGFVIDRYWGKYTRQISGILPMISVVAITMIVAAVVSHNASRIFETGAVVFVVVVLHNLLGYVGGYALGKAMGVSSSKKKALAIEIGMQNSGLATSLARTSFPTLEAATVPGAIFSVWHNISGAILAQIFRRVDDGKTESVEKVDRYSARAKRRKKRGGR